jgi:hypothetical protein
MTSVTDEVATLELILAQTDRIVSSMRDDEWSLPSTVRRLSRRA